MGAASCKSSKATEPSREAENTKKITIGIFGLDDAGKTSTVKAIENSRTKNVTPTDDFHTSTVPYPKGDQDKRSQEKVTIIDVSGNRSYREKSWASHYGNIHGLIFVIDASNRNRMVENKRTLTSLLAHDKLRNKPILILANKQDLPDAINDEDDIKDELCIGSLRAKYKIELCVAIPSRKANEGSIREGFTWLIRTIEENYSQLNAQVQREGNFLQSNPASRKSRRSDSDSQSEDEDRVVYGNKKRTTSPTFNENSRNHRFQQDLRKLPALDFNKPKRQATRHDTYSEDDGNDSDKNDTTIRSRRPASPSDTNNRHRDDSTNEQNMSTRAKLNKKKKLIGASGRDATNRKFDDDEPKPFRSTYESFSEDPRIGSTLKRSTKTDDLSTKSFSRPLTANDSSKGFNRSPLVNDAVPYKSGALPKASGFSDHEDDEMLSQRQKNKPNWSTKDTSKASQPNYDDYNDRFKKDNNRFSYGAPATTLASSKRFGRDDDKDDEDGISSLKKGPFNTKKKTGSDDEDGISSLKKGPFNTKKKTGSDDEDGSSSLKKGPFNTKKKTGSDDEDDDYRKTKQKPIKRGNDDEDDDDIRKSNFKQNNKPTWQTKNQPDDDDYDYRSNKDTTRRLNGTKPAITSTTSKKFSNEENDYDKDNYIIGSLKKGSYKTVKNESDDEDDNKTTKDTPNSSFTNRNNFGTDNRRTTSKPPSLPPSVSKRWNDDDSGSRFDRDPLSTLSSSKPITNFKSSNDYSSSLSKSTTQPKYGQEDRSPSPPLSRKLNDKPSTTLNTRLRNNANDAEDSQRSVSRSKPLNRFSYDDDDDDKPVTKKSNSRFDDDDDDRPSTASKSRFHPQTPADDFQPTSKKNYYS